ncbi:MAG: hypothetical protein J0J10_15620 [Bosea sp.]|uniref:hypothetical protein n=1 Tax=Bosea sp. (in: a-proteobacteria) TaxID=1871050 RepID=UPI001AC27C05|nr:hypothetical protein [Bosea sp. (in: a-proteobacteria)]MBN9470192.1 hypothetical protein [Bosea sp. (in: a-proteobacteria)]
MTRNAVNNLLPSETYTLEIVESEYVPTCDGLGMVLKCKAQVVGGPYEGRPYWLNYCLEHQSDERMEAGQRAFAGLRRATGVLSPNFSTDLHWKPFDVQIWTCVNKKTGQPQNVVRQYLFEHKKPERRARNVRKRNERVARVKALLEMAGVPA